MAQVRDGRRLDDCNVKAHRNRQSLRTKTDAYELCQTVEFTDEEHRQDIEKVIDAFYKHYCATASVRSM